MPPKRQIFKLNVLESLLASENSCVTLVPCTKLLAVPPFFLNDMKSGIIFLLNSFLKKYDRALNGIPIGYQKVKVLMDENTGIIQMGNAETEVNVSVEFYIFQPKVGSSLRGVINKKSRTHIGCLVHKYFNATILKPETVEYEDWLCKDLNINDTIVFKVKDLDFTGLLPHIEGIIDDENFITKKFQEIKKKQTPSEKSSFTTGLSKQKEKFDDTAQSKVLDAIVNSDSSFDKNEPSIKKKKKKSKVKDKEQKLLNEMEEDEMESMNVGEKEEKIEDEVDSKKKKKKKKSRDKEEVTDSLQLTNTIENVTQMNEQSEEQQFVMKKKKKKKKDKDVSDFQDKSLKDESQSLSLTEDNIFYSTQLEPSKPLGKPLAPFCSPIPQKKEENGLSSHNEEDFEKKSSKKRKKEELNDSKSQKIKVEEEKQAQPSMQELLDKIFKEQISRINQESSDRDDNSSSSKKKKSESLLSNPKKKKDRDKSHSIIKETMNVQDEKTKAVESSRKMVEGKKKERDKSQPTIPEILLRTTNRKDSVSDVEMKKSKNQELLYEKLLSEARNSISADVSSTPVETKKLKSEETNTQRKLKRKKDTLDESDGLSSPKKFKNGNMYDYSLSPSQKKIDPDKSLFSDSDSNTKQSPKKREKKMNGLVEKEKEKDFSTESVMKKLIQEEKKRLESESEGSMNRSSKERKNKKKKKKEKKEEAKESLYEKLLKHARSSINLSEV